MVICLQRDADLHIAQLMPLTLTVSCFSKIQIGFTSLVPAHPGSPGQRAVKWVCVCVCVCVCVSRRSVTKLHKYSRGVYDEMAYEVGGFEATLAAALELRLSSALRGAGPVVTGRVTVLQMALESAGVRRHVAAQRAAVLEVLRHVVQVRRPRRTCITHDNDIFITSPHTYTALSSVYSLLVNFLILVYIRYLIRHLRMLYNKSK